MFVLDTTNVSREVLFSAVAVSTHVCVAVAVSSAPIVTRDKEFGNARIKR
jgi:hypothetical protein